nr:unnamed protein product [Leishmania braziliensis]
MTSTRNKFLLALVALVLLATYAAAVKGDCTVENCATCLEEDATKCAECKPGYKRTDAGTARRSPAMSRTARRALKRTPPSARSANLATADRRRHLRGISCDVANCATCAAGSTTQCAECKPGYKRTDAGSARRSPAMSELRDVP